MNLAFPAIGRDFAGSSVSDLTWIITAYAVLFAALLTSAGRLADAIGRRRVFITGVVVFTAASTASALAPSPLFLIVARFVQGAGAALTLPSGLGIILGQTPPERRASAIGIWGAAAGAAAAIGPTVSGFLVELVSWRAVFLINVPLGCFIGWVAWRSVSDDVRSRQELPDPLGIALLAAGIGLVVLGISKGSDWGWSSAPATGSLLAGVALTAAALFRARHRRAPALEVGLWRSRAFAVSNVASWWFGMAGYPMMLASVLFLTQIWRYSPIEAGLAMSPGAVSGAVAAAAAGRIGDRFGQRLPAVFGALALIATNVWIINSLDAHRAFASLWLWLSLLSGVGLGTVSVALSGAAALATRPSRFAAATGMNLTARQIGGAIGIAALAVILQANLRLGSQAYIDVYVFALFASCASGLASLAIVRRRAAQPQSDRAESRAPWSPEPAAR